MPFHTLARSRYSPTLLARVSLGWRRIAEDERRGVASAAHIAADLAALGAPMAAAFDRQSVLSGPREPVSTALMAPLSRREAEIAGMLLIGCSSEAIALRLSISRHTVKDHRKQIFRKLGVGSLAELFALHRRLG